MGHDEGFLNAMYWYRAGLASSYLVAERSATDGGLAAQNHPPPILNQGADDPHENTGSMLTRSGRLRNINPDVSVIAKFGTPDVSSNLLGSQ